MKKILFLSLLMTILLVSCRSTAEPSQTAIPTIPPPTDTAVPTETEPPTAVPSPTEPSQPPTVAPPDLASAGVLPAEWVKLTLPSWIATFQVASTPGMPYDPNVPPELNGFPPHLLVSFDDDLVLPDIFTTLQRQMRIFPVAAYQEMYAQAGNEDLAQRILTLQQLLSARPAVIEGPIPVLPGTGAVQALKAQVKYLDFTGGSGIAFLAYYTQDASPLTNENLTYFFQGLSHDGTQYISMVYPVDSPRLPNTINEVPPETLQIATEENPRYLEETAQLLDEAAPTEFIPNLDELNSMVSSLVLGQAAVSTPTQMPTATFAQPTAIPTQPGAVPTATLGQVLPPGPTHTPSPTKIQSELVGVNWYWTSITHPDDDTDAPDDPDEYVLLLNPDGTVSVKADCNTASGSYRLRDKNRLTIDLTSGGSKDCGDDSLSEMFMARLEDAETYEIEKNKLDIDLSIGGSMRFSK